MFFYVILVLLMMRLSIVLRKRKYDTVLIDFLIIFSSGGSNRSHGFISFVIMPVAAERRSYVVLSAGVTSLGS